MRGSSSSGGGGHFSFPRWMSGTLVVFMTVTPIFYFFFIMRDPTPHTSSTSSSSSFIIHSQPSPKPSPSPKIDLDPLLSKIPNLKLDYSGEVIPTELDLKVLESRLLALGKIKPPNSEWSIPDLISVVNCKNMGNERFILFQSSTGNGGLGDRFIGFYSAAIIARLTKRHLVVNWGPDQNMWNVNIKPLRKESRWSVISHCFSGNEIQVGMNWYDPRMGQLAERPLSELFLSNVSTYSGNQGINRMIMNNPHEKDKFAAFPDGWWWKDFHSSFTPAGEFREKLIRRLKDYEDSYVIAMQIRIAREEWRELVQTPAMAKFLDWFTECSSRIVANLSHSDHPKRDLPLKFFVASDNPDAISGIKSRLKEKYMKEPIIIQAGDEEGPLVHFDRSSPQEREAGFLRILLDVWMMMYSDEFILTHASNFGRVAAFGMPYYPIGLYYSANHNPSCPRKDIQNLLIKDTSIM